MFNPIVILNGFSKLFDLVQSVVFVQLILVFLFSSVIFGLVLLNKTNAINMSEENSKALSVTICCLIFPAMLVGGGVVAVDIFVFPYLFEMFWVG